MQDLLNCENCFLQNIPARNANFIFNDEVGVLFWFNILITSKSDNFIWAPGTPLYSSATTLKEYNSVFAVVYLLLVVVLVASSLFCGLIYIKGAGNLCRVMMLGAVSLIASQIWFPLERQWNERYHIYATAIFNELSTYNIRYSAICTAFWIHSGHF